MTELSNQPAFIYCRVSSAKQVRDGHGLESQEARCREFARYRGHQVVEVFRDEAVSGGLINRPGMKDMLTRVVKFARKTQPVIIIDDISRLARGVEAHIQFRTAISSAGGKLESPSIEFGDDSDSILVENLLASVSQHQRQQNAEQVVNRMKARVMAGYWVFSPVAGYRYEDVKGHGRMIVPNEPNATAVREAMEGFASGRFASQMEVKHFLETFPSFPRMRNGQVSLFQVRRVLTRSLYAGYIDVDKWGIELQKGNHEPLVSFETWRKVRDRLNAKPPPVVHVDTNADFPLRGHVTCASCEHPMTGAWSQGRTKRYAYYFCQTRDCPERRKSIPKEKIEGAFEAFLKTLTPRPELFNLARKMLAEHWEARNGGAKERRATLTTEIRLIESKVEGIMGRLIDCDSPTLIKAYEEQIKKFETRKILLAEQAAGAIKPRLPFDEAYRTACTFLGNPWKLWTSEHYEHKKMVLKLAFGGKIPYDRMEGYRTAIPTLPFKVLAGFSRPNGKVVGPEGLEPPTTPL
jgi:site-specific DNA recombinase